jgi:mannose-6-phosphate isomerase-like protein (cupin superfamily)
MRGARSHADRDGAETPVKPVILRASRCVEFPTAERCYISEWSNSEHDPGVSIAHARVPVGVTTRWHRLNGIAERYVVVGGRGRVEIGDEPPCDVAPGDVVLIPPSCRQRIACIGGEELAFLAICSPRFRPDAYEDLEPWPADAGRPGARR